MTAGLDTSVVLRLLVGKPEAQMRAAVALLDERQKGGDPVVVGDLVLAEAYFALQFHYGISKADALAALGQMLSSGEIGAAGQAGQILALPGLAKAKPGFVDRLIHAAYADAGAEMATFEKASGKLANVRVLQ